MFPCSRFSVQISSGLVWSPCLLALRLCPQWPAAGAGVRCTVCAAGPLSRLIGRSVKEHLPAEPRCVFRGADGETDGTRVLEDLVVISTLIREQILKINNHKHTSIQIHGHSITHQRSFVAEKEDGVQSFLFQDVQTEAFVPALREDVKTDQTPCRQWQNTQLRDNLEKDSFKIGVTLSISLSTTPEAFFQIMFSYVFSRLQASTSFIH